MTDTRIDADVSATRDEVEKAVAPTPKADTQTQYVLLSLEGPAKGWLYREEVTARSADAAIRSFAEAAGLTEPATLIAVPARSWRPVTVKPQTVTTLVIEDA